MNKTRMLVVIAVVAVVGTLAWTLINRPKPSVRSESDAERDQSMRAAFTTTVGRGDAKDVTGDAELVAEITEFFKALGTAFDEGDRSKLKNLVSGEMMIDYAQRSGVLDLSSLGPMRQVSFRRQFTNGLLQGLATHGKNNAFTRPRVVRVEQISKREVLAYMRSQSVWLGVETKSRWWLLKNLAGEWQAYDWEDLDSGIRTSTLMGAMAGPNTSAPWNQDALNLLQAVQQLQASEEFDPTQLREPCEKLLAHKVPAVIESLARGLLAAALLTGEDADGALEEIDKIVELNGGATPSDHYVRAECYLFKGEPQKAIEQFILYTEVLGWDSDVHERLSDCYYELGDMPKSIEHAEKGLADNPQSPGCLASLAVSLPAERHDEILKHLEKFEERQLAYESILDYAIEVEHRVAYDLILPRFTADFPDEKDLIEYYEENPPPADEDEGTEPAEA